MRESDLLEEILSLGSYRKRLGFVRKLLSILL